MEHWTIQHFSVVKMHAFFQPRKPKASQHTDSDSSKAIKGDDNVESANNEKENTEATSAKTQKLSTSKISKLATPGTLHAMVYFNYTHTRTLSISLL